MMNDGGKFGRIKNFKFDISWRKNSPQNSQSNTKDYIQKLNGILGLRYSFYMKYKLHQLDHRNHSIRLILMILVVGRDVWDVI